MSNHLNVFLRRGGVEACHKELVVDACNTLDIIGITVFADFWLLIGGFSGIISFTLQLYLKIYI